MGLSRNKVAVSEGAAGSPPFYGERGRHESVVRIRRTQNKGKKRRDEGSRIKTLLFDFEGPLGDTGFLKKKTWGCSSVGRAPALQAGGHGFESHHLHHRTVSGAEVGDILIRTGPHHTMGKRERIEMTALRKRVGNGTNQNIDGLIAQLVRARA